MSIKCGNCGKKHDTVIEVRQCHGAQAEATDAAEVMDKMEGVDRVINPPSEKQVAYVRSLLAEHQWPDTLTEEDLRAMERRQVSRLIERIKGSPRKEYAGATVRSYGTELPDVPAGRYAILSTHPNTDDSSEEGNYDFFQVDRPTEGKWKGSTFLSQLFGAPGDYQKVKLFGRVARAVLNDIAKDPEYASLTYGRVSEVCGVCHSPLTNKKSRNAGIGPVCASKTGWGRAA